MGNLHVFVIITAPGELGSTALGDTFELWVAVTTFSLGPSFQPFFSCFWLLCQNLFNFLVGAKMLF